jgi:hypothetical protein
VASSARCLRARRSQPHAVNGVVQAALQHVEQVVAGDAFHRAGFFEQIAELSFEQLIITARLLFFAELQAVAHDLRFAVLAVLAGREVALLDGALFGVAALAFQEQLHALAPALPTNGANVSRQIEPP